MSEQPDVHRTLEPLASSARALMARSREEALQLHHTELRPEHLLLAVLDTASLTDQRERLREELTPGPVEPMPTRLRPDRRLRRVLAAAAARSHAGDARPRDLLESMAREDSGLAGRWLRGPEGDTVRGALPP